MVSTIFSCVSMHHICTCPILSRNWLCFKCRHDSFLSSDGLTKKIIYSLLIIKTLKANFIGVIPNFLSLVYRLQFTGKMRMNVFLLRKVQKTECDIVYVGSFLLLSNYVSGYDIDRVHLRLGYTVIFHKSITFLLVVIVIDSTIFKER